MSNCKCQHDCRCSDEKARYLEVPFIAALDDFYGFREAYFQTYSSKLNLQNWQGYAHEDFGAMLGEWWALLGDNLARYSTLRQAEYFVSTAELESSLREIAALLGYAPVPPIASEVEIAVTTSKSKAFDVSARSLFLSEGYDDLPSFEYETKAVQHVDPERNEWSVATLYSKSFEPGHIYVDQNTRNIRNDEPIVFIHTASNNVIPAIVEDIESGNFPDGSNYGEIILANNGTSGSTTIDGLTDDPFESIVIKGFRSQIDVTTSDDGHIEVPILVPQLRKGDRVALVIDDAVYTAKIKTLKQFVKTIPIDGSQSEADIVRVPCMRITVYGAIPANIPPNANATLYYSVMPAGRLIGAPFSKISATQFGTLIPLQNRLAPLDHPYEGAFILRDANDTILRFEGQLEIDAINGKASIIHNNTFANTPTLTYPIKIYGNLLNLRQGGLINEVLGTGRLGDFQSYKLAKKNLSFDRINGSIQPDIRVFVSEIEWTRRESFYGASPTDNIFMVNLEDDGHYHIKFGGGGFGALLPVGAQIRAEYRVGATGDNVEAFRVNQSRLKSAKLRSIFNPFAAIGGVLPDRTNDIRNSVPMHLGSSDRIVSLQDFIYAARKLGAKSAIAYKQWDQKSFSHQIQVIAVMPEGQGDISAIANDIAEQMRGMAKEGTSITVRPAVPVSVRITLQVRAEKNANPLHVKSEIEHRLTAAHYGLLSREKIEIGHHYHRSEILAPLARIKGIHHVERIALDDDSQLNAVIVDAHQFIHPELDLEVLR